MVAITILSSFYFFLSRERKREKKKEKRNSCVRDHCQRISYDKHFSTLFLSSLFLLKQERRKEEKERKRGCNKNGKQMTRDPFVRAKEHQQKILLLPFFLFLFSFFLSLSQLYQPGISESLSNKWSETENLREKDSHFLNSSLLSSFSFSLKFSKKRERREKQREKKKREGEE